MFLGPYIPTITDPMGEEQQEWGSYFPPIGLADQGLWLMELKLRGRLRVPSLYDNAGVETYGRVQHEVPAPVEDR